MRALLAWAGWDIGQLLAAVVGMITSATFVARYHIESGGTWWRHENGAPNHVGRFLLPRKAMVFFLFAYLLLGRVPTGRVFTPETWPGQDFVLFLLILGFAAQTLQPYRLLVRAQRAQDMEVTR